MSLTNQEKGVLLLGARESIKTLFSDIPEPALNFQYYPNLLKPYGAFVTLKKSNELRGCIGYITSEEPLFNTVCEVARLAASEDPRFRPVTEEEVTNILIEISVLSLPEPIGDYEEIVIGKHGLLLDDENAQAVLLPQVAVEQKWGIAEFLSGICQKANLPSNLWMKQPLNLRSFTAEVFGEQRRYDLTKERR